MTQDSSTSPDARDETASATSGSPSSPSDTPADRTTDPASSGEGERERRGPPPNPLYHPLFLPVLLVGFTLWFFWDGFLTTDPEMQEHQLFNRVFFGITLLFCLRIVPRGIREFREDREAAEAARSADEKQ